MSLLKKLLTGIKTLGSAAVKLFETGLYATYPQTSPEQAINPIFFNSPKLLKRTSPQKLDNTYKGEIVIQAPGSCHP